MNRVVRQELLPRLRDEFPGIAGSFEGSQAYHLVPMAISLGFGIIFSTSIMLAVVPCLYLMLEDIKVMSARG